MHPRLAFGIVGLGMVVAAGALVAWATCDCAKLPLEAMLARAVAGLAFIAVGVVALNQRGSGRVGALMTAVGFAWFVDDLGWIYAPLPYSVARFGAGFFQPLLAHLAVVFPYGRLRSQLDRAVVIAGYGLWFASALAVQSVWDPADAGCPACPRNLFMIDRDPRLHDLFEQLTTGVSLAFTAVAFGVVVRHWSTASVPARRALDPVLWASVPLASVVVIYSLIGRSFAPSWAPLALTALPAGFLVGVLRIRLSRAAVGRLVIDLSHASPVGSSTLRDVLARTLDDPSLQVAYWMPERRAFIGADGTIVQLPTAARSGRITTLVERDGEPIAALIHDVAVKDDPELIEAVAAAARLAIENGRMQAEIMAQLQEVRASRARLVEAAGAERRRIERNLHDGSQQRLVTLALALSMAQARVTPDAHPELASILREAAEELKHALAELRELARGIHPAILTEAGLGPALSSLAERCSVPVTVAAVPSVRLPAAVEVAAYFVVAECLANAAKHARASSVTVTVEHTDSDLVVQVIDDGVGGAEFVEGSGLQGLADRVGALGGRLDVLSPPGGGTRVVAMMSCQ
jgi:signal transduction histidine kinase